MPRPIEYDRKQVLEQATQLFWQKGYSQTSIRDLLQATGFNRHSLYETFGGKQGIFAAVLQYYRQHYMDAVISTLRAADSDIESIRSVFAIRAEMDRKQCGCLVSNTSNEKHCIDQVLHDLALEYCEELEQAVQICIRNAKQKGQVKADKDERLLAKYMVTLMHGFGPLSKSGHSVSDTTAIGELFIETLTA